MRTIKLLLAAVAMLAVMCSGSAFAASNKTTNVKYREDGVEKTTVGDVYIIDDQLEDFDKEWYVVKGHPKFTVPLKFTNASGVSIILADGATLEVSVEIDSFENNGPPAIGADDSLTIYAQSTDRKTMGCISADMMNTFPSGGIFSRAIYVQRDITIQGGIIKARASLTTLSAGARTSCAIMADTLAVGAGAVVDAHASTNRDDSLYAIFLNDAFISSGDVTATATRETMTGPAAHGITFDDTSGKTLVIAGGVCRATADGIGDLSGIRIPKKDLELAVKGGWVESSPPISSSDLTFTPTHTGGVLIDGDIGTVKGTAVIPAGMTATLRDGVTLTVEPDAKIVNYGELYLPDSITTKEEVKALKITGTGRIYWKGRPIHGDGEQSYDEAIAEASKMFGEESSAWTPEDGDWEIVVSMDSAIEIDGVSIDGKGLSEDADWSIKAASLGGISAKAETERTVVISAETLSALIDETAAKEHTLRITMTDDGYAIMTFWVAKAVPSEDGPGEDDDPTTPTRRGSSGACASGSAVLAAIAALAMIKRRAR